MKTTKHRLKLELAGTKTGKWKPAKSQPRRRKQAKAQGEQCFLKRTRTKSGQVDYGYPVCNSAGRITCQGTQAAFRRARTQGDGKVAKKAQTQARKLSCAWAMKRKGN